MQATARWSTGYCLGSSLCFLVQSATIAKVRESHVAAREQAGYARLLAWLKSSVLCLAFFRQFFTQDKINTLVPFLSMYVLWFSTGEEERLRERKTWVFFKVRFLTFINLT